MPSQTALLVKTPHTSGIQAMKEAGTCAPLASHTSMEITGTMAAGATRAAPDIS